MLHVLIVLLLGGVRAQAQPPQAKPSYEEEDRLVTRRGAVILEKSVATLTAWRVRLRDKALIETESDELGLWERFEGDDGYDYVIVKRSSGGIACPYQFLVIDISPTGVTSVSKEFGSCLDPVRTRLYGNALVLDMPAYTPHPDLITPREVQENARTVEIFTVRHGRITERSEVRK